MEIINILGLILISTLVGFGFNIMQDIGMIFEWYKEWLNYLANNKFKTFGYRVFLLKLWWNTVVIFKLHRINLPAFKLSKSKYWHCSTSVSHKQYKVLYYITKPLGLCIICNTTWIGIISGIVLLDMPIGQKIFSSILIGVASGGLVTIVKLDHKRLLT